MKEKYLFIMKESYHEIEFTFDDYNAGCEFALQAMKASNAEIKFIVKTCFEKEGEANEVI